MLGDYGVGLPVDFAGSYNFAPSQNIPVLYLSQEQKLVFASPWWGLVPAWLKGRAVGSPLSQARAESAAVLPSFRESWRKSRCLILAEGYFEWPKRLEGGRCPPREPYLLTLEGGRPFVIAGLLNTVPNASLAQGRVSQELNCALLTTPATKDIEWLHQRMPLLMEPAAAHRWLHGEDPVGWTGRMETRLVSQYVNNVAHHGPRCLEARPGLFD